MNNHYQMQEDFLPHARVVRIEAPVEHVKSTTRPFDSVNNSIRS